MILLKREEVSIPEPDDEEQSQIHLAQKASDSLGYRRLAKKMKNRFGPRPLGQVLKELGLMPLCPASVRRYKQWTGLLFWKKWLVYWFVLVVVSLSGGLMIGSTALDTALGLPGRGDWVIIWGGLMLFLGAPAGLIRPAKEDEHGVPRPPHTTRDWVRTAISGYEDRVPESTLVAATTILDHSACPPSTSFYVDELVVKYYDVDVWNPPYPSRLREESHQDRFLVCVNGQEEYFVSHWK